jgi:hypothetical protein
MEPSVPDLVEVWLNQSLFAKGNRFEVVNAGSSS